MSRRVSGLLFWSVLLLTVAFPRVASAWVETVVRSHQARVEVAEDGTAIVRHELVLKVRGGPMKSLEIGGVGSIGDPLPDALVRRAVEGSSSTWPLTVSALEDGSLRLGIGAERGLRGGSYLFAFAYSLDLKEQGRISPLGDGVEVTFIGPRLTSGVDSAKVTFVVPRGSRAPQLGEQDESGAGVLLGEVRRGAEFDEVELVRAHLAVGEPAIWRVIVAPNALAKISGDAQSKDLVGSAPTPTLNTSDLLQEQVSTRYLPLVGAIALFFALLTFFKARVTRAAAKLSEARVKPLIPGPAWLRGFLVLAAVGGAGFLVFRQEPWTAMLCLCAAAAVGTHLLPVRVARPRGPGIWEPVDLPSRPSRRPLPGSMFETRTLVGFLSFSVLVLAIVAAAYRILPESNYYALMCLSLVLLLIPSFWTGRLRDLPQSPAEQARPWLQVLRKAVDPRIASVELWGRRSSMGDESAGSRPLEAYDETRIRIVLLEAPQGLRALEVSLDEAAGACVLPCIVVRALEDSPAVSCLPADIPWQRGRAAEERVAVLRPTAPTPSQLMRLLKSLMTNLRAAYRSSDGAMAARSEASGASTMNDPMLKSEQAM